VKLGNTNFRRVSAPHGSRTKYTYDADGNLTTITLPNGVIETYKHDTLNRTITILARNGGGATIRR
jgi:YD repeat-containing protein